MITQIKEMLVVVVAWAAVLLVGVTPARAGVAVGLTLGAERGASYDLEIVGGLEGVTAGESRFVTWAELRALPARTITLEGEFVPGLQEVTIVDLATVWERLPVAAGRDAVLAWCTDGYMAVFRAAEVAALRPFVVLEINGRGPEFWPPEGLGFNPGPYVISVDETVSAAVRELVSEANKKPWGVARLEFVTYADAFGPVLTAILPHEAEAGRKLWINVCASCHTGPEGVAGGTKGARPFLVLAAHAEFNADYFARYVRDPKSINPAAVMEAHGHLNAGHIEALRQFVMAMRKQ